jgi:hypothetical protein
MAAEARKKVQIKIGDRKKVFTCTVLAYRLGFFCIHRALNRTTLKSVMSHKPKAGSDLDALAKKHKLTSKLFLKNAWTISHVPSGCQVFSMRNSYRIARRYLVETVKSASLEAISDDTELAKSAFPKYWSGYAQHCWNKTTFTKYEAYCKHRGLDHEQ